jgi:hypothetical protein
LKRVSAASTRSPVSRANGRTEAPDDPDGPGKGHGAGCARRAPPRKTSLLTFPWVLSPAPGVVGGGRRG